MNISAPFIRGPVATTLLTVGAGARRARSAYRLLPVSPLPQVEFPTIQVSARAARREPGDDGLGGGDAARAAVRPHRRRHRDDLDQLPRLDDASRCSSTSSRNIDAAARDVQAAINAARGQLPANLPNNPTYRKVNPADAPILILALTSDTVDTGRACTTRPPSILQQKLSQVEGVGQVFVGGGSLPAVRVELNPDGAEQATASAWTTCAPRSAPPTPTGRRGSSPTATTRWAIGTTDQLLQRRASTGR